MRNYLLFFMLFILLCGTQSAWAETICSNSPSSGTSCDFNAYDYSSISPSEISVSTTCRATSGKSFIFVEDSLWNNGVVQSDVNALQYIFEGDGKTGDVGIYGGVSGILGGMPDNWDHVDQLYIVVQDIQDSPLYPVTGYHRKADLEKDIYNQPSPGSNKHEIVFLHYEDLTGSVRQADLAREMAAICHWRSDQDEDPWVEDSISRSVVWMLGNETDFGSMETYTGNPQPLFGKEVAGRIELDHGATTLFGVYLLKRVGELFMGDWAIESENGTEGLLAALQFNGIHKTFGQFLHEWGIAMLVNKGEYSFGDFNPPSVSSYVVNSLPKSLYQSIKPLTSQYVRINLGNLSEGDGLRITVTPPVSPEALLSMAWEKSGSTDLEVQDKQLTPNEENVFELEDIDSDWDWLSLILTRYSDGVDLSWNVNVEILQEIDGDIDGDAPVDGDDESDGDMEQGEEEPDGDSEAIDGDEFVDGDESVDGDEVTDGDEAVDGDQAVDGDEEPLIFGELDCHKVNRCYADCAESACREACIQNGTLEAQDQWIKYVACLQGQNPEKLNCIELVTKAERDDCEYRNCFAFSEACKLIDEVLPEEDGGDGGCSSTGGAALPLFMLAMIGMFMGRRAKHSRP